MVRMSRARCFPAGLIRPPPRAVSQISAARIPAYLRVILNGASQSLVNMQGFSSSLIMIFRICDFEIVQISLYYFFFVEKTSSFMGFRELITLGRPRHPVFYDGLLPALVYLLRDLLRRLFFSLLLASFCSHFFGVAVSLLFDPLRVDLGLARGPSDPQQ